MLIKQMAAAQVMGFARYERQEGVAPEDILAAALRWQEDFLAAQDGILFHAFLGNLRGQFADLILARDEIAFDNMSKNHPTAKASEDFMALLDPASIRLSRNIILKDGITPTTDFSCVEFGTFQLSDSLSTTAADVQNASDHIEATYLKNSMNTRAHFVSQIDDRTFSETVFGRTMAATRRVCAGYVGDPDCEALLKLFDPESVELDFWFLLG